MHSPAKSLPAEKVATYWVNKGNIRTSSIKCLCAQCFASFWIMTSDGNKHVSEVIEVPQKLWQKHLQLCCQHCACGSPSNTGTMTYVGTMVTDLTAFEGLNLIFYCRFWWRHHMETTLTLLRFDSFLVVGMSKLLTFNKWWSRHWYETP